MTEIIVNNKILTTLSQAQGKTVNDVMQFILQNYASEEDIVSNILLDEQNIPFDNEESYFKSEVRNYKKISFVLNTRLDMAFDALDSCNFYVENIINNIAKASEAYRTGNLGYANQVFAEIVEHLDLFTQLMTQVHQIIKVGLGRKMSSGNTFHNLEIHLLSILRTLLPAKEKQDYVMLCDLLEYELVDNLTQWKTTAIPELKQLKSN